MCPAINRHHSGGRQYRVAPALLQRGCPRSITAYTYTLQVPLFPPSPPRGCTLNAVGPVCEGTAAAPAAKIAASSAALRH